MSPLRSAPPADLSLPSSPPIGQLCVAPWSGSAPLALEPGVARRLFLSALLSSPHSALLCSGPPQPAWPLTGQPGSCSPLGLGSATPPSLLIGCFSPWGCAACLPPFLLPLFLLSHSFLPTACRSGHLLSSCSPTHPPLSLLSFSSSCAVMFTRYYIIIHNICNHMHNIVVNLSELLS